MSIIRNIIHSQCKGCALAIQIGYTLLTFGRGWPGKRANVIYIAAPYHDGTRYRRWRFGINRHCNLPKQA